MHCLKCLYNLEYLNYNRKLKNNLLKKAILGFKYNHIQKWRFLKHHKYNILYFFSNIFPIFIYHNHIRKPIYFSKNFKFKIFVICPIRLKQSYNDFFYIVNDQQFYHYIFNNNTIIIILYDHLHKQLKKTPNKQHFQQIQYQWKPPHFLN